MATVEPAVMYGGTITIIDCSDTLGGMSRLTSSSTFDMRTLEFRICAAVTVIACRWTCIALYGLSASSRTLAAST